MTRSLVTTMIVAGVVAVAAQASKAQTPPAAPMTKKITMPNKAAIETALVANEQKINDAVMKGDAAAFKSLTATEGMGGDANGFMSTTDFAKTIKPGMAKVTDMKLSGFKVLWINDTSAVLTYTWSGKGTFMDQPVPSPVYVSTVYVNRGDKWLALYHQETPAAPVPPKK